MKHSCESRIRSYTKEVRDVNSAHAAKVPGNIASYWRAALLSQLVEATKSIQEDKVRKEFLEASQFLVETLKAAKYNGCYFDRTEKKQERLCTKEGWFTCQVQRGGVAIKDKS